MEWEPHAFVSKVIQNVSSADVYKIDFNLANMSSEIAD